MTDEFSREELIIARIAKEFHGENIATGVTILSDLASRLAKALYEPDLILVGGSLAAWDCEVHPKCYNDEWVDMGTAATILDWPQDFDMISADKLQIWTGPAQLDRCGNSNISVVGDWARPKVQLVGARGIPDDLWRVSRICYHIVRHSPRLFVEHVDFVCGLGYGEERRRLGLTTGWPGVAVSDLGVFTWNPVTGDPLIESLHPGVPLNEVVEKTGFTFANAHEEVRETVAPTREELRLIRDVLDPLGWRRLESAAPPPGLLEQLLAEESAFLANIQQSL